MCICTFTETEINNSNVINANKRRISIKDNVLGCFCFCFLILCCEEVKVHVSASTYGVQKRACAPLELELAGGCEPPYMGVEN